jgi:hypothetical protein
MIDDPWIRRIACWKYNYYQDVSNSSVTLMVMYHERYLKASLTTFVSEYQTRLPRRAKADWRGPIKKTEVFWLLFINKKIFLKRGTLSADSSAEGSELLRQDNVAPTCAWGGAATGLTKLAAH